MALISPVPQNKTLLGTITTDRVFTCRQGMVAITTDNGEGADHYPLSEGQRLVIPTGVTVHYWSIAPEREMSVLHHMPLGV